MRTPSFAAHHRAVLALLALACLAVALAATSGLANAGEPPPLEADPGQCVLCHQAEVQDWQSSPHAAATAAIESAMMACEEGEDCSCLSCHTTNFSPATGVYEHSGVTCEACHGPLAEGHPENGTMTLAVDSSVCSDCHVETFQDWQTTAHAQADVQCIGCHRSHTQNLRLEDQVLCKSCHRDHLQDAGHLAHLRTGLDCVSCHTSPASSPHVADGPSGPTHQFAVNTEACTACHGNTFHRGETTAALAVAQPIIAAAGTQTGEATSRQEIVAERSAVRRITQASAMSLGLGIGIGAMAGIVFVLGVGILIQRPWRGRS